MKAPNFSAVDENGQAHTLASYKGKWLVIYFYPKDMTPGCTVEACAFRDNYEALQAKGVELLGVSKDSGTSHQKFVTKHDLPFPLLVDADLSVAKGFGAFGKKKFMGREYEGILRNTYIVDPKGEIVKTYESVKPIGHAKQILKDLAELQA